MGVDVEHSSEHAFDPTPQWAARLLRLFVRKDRLNPQIQLLRSATKSSGQLTQLVNYQSSIIIDQSTLVNRVASSQLSVDAARLADQRMGAGCIRLSIDPRQFQPPPPIPPSIDLTPLLESSFSANTTPKPWVARSLVLVLVLLLELTGDACEHCEGWSTHPTPSHARPAHHA